MRLIALALIGIGAAFAIGIPWFSSNLTGEDIATIVLYEKGEGWKASDVALSTSNNPLQVRVNVYRLPGKITNNGKLKILIRGASGNVGKSVATRVLDEEITLSLDLGSSSATGQGTPEVISATTRNFEIPKDGSIKFGAIPISLEGKAISRNSKQFDRNIVRIDAVLKSDVTPVSNRNVTLGLVFAGLGIFLFFRLSRRKPVIEDSDTDFPEERNESDEQYPDEQFGDENKIDDEPQPAPPLKKPTPKTKPVKKKKAKQRKTSAGKSIRWGRDADKDQW